MKIESRYTIDPISSFEKFMGRLCQRVLILDIPVLRFRRPILPRA